MWRSSNDLCLLLLFALLLPFQADPAFRKDPISTFYPNSYAPSQRPEDFSACCQWKSHTDGYGIWKLGNPIFG